jgi:hypothetical protein
LEIQKEHKRFKLLPCMVTLYKRARGMVFLGEQGHSGKFRLGIKPLLDVVPAKVVCGVRGEGILPHSIHF